MAKTKSPSGFPIRPGRPVVIDVTKGVDSGIAPWYERADCKTHV